MHRLSRWMCLNTETILHGNNHQAEWLLWFIIHRILKKLICNLNHQQIKQRSGSWSSLSRVCIIGCLLMLFKELFCVYIQLTLNRIVLKFLDGHVHVTEQHNLAPRKIQTHSVQNVMRLWMWTYISYRYLSPALFTLNSATKDEQLQ